MLPAVAAIRRVHERGAVGPTDKNRNGVERLVAAAWVRKRVVARQCVPEWLAGRIRVCFAHLGRSPGVLVYRVILASRAAGKGASHTAATELRFMRRYYGGEQRMHARRTLHARGCQASATTEKGIDSSRSAKDMSRESCTS